MKKTKLFCNIFLISCFTLCSFLGVSACNNSKGNYFVPSEYIIAYASLTSTTTSSNGNVEYVINVNHKSDITLNYLKYECNLYKNNDIIQTFTGLVPMNGLYARYIPLKTTKEYDFAKVVCSGWSDENPENFMRIRTNKAHMQTCNHEYMINAQVHSITTNNKTDFMIINFNSETSYNSFKFMYDDYYRLSGDILVCMSCGYYSKK